MGHTSERRKYHNSVNNTWDILRSIMNAIVRSKESDALRCLSYRLLNSHGCTLPGLSLLFRDVSMWFEMLYRLYHVYICIHLIYIWFIYLIYQDRSKNLMLDASWWKSWWSNQKKACWLMKSSRFHRQISMISPVFVDQIRRPPRRHGCHEAPPEKTTTDLDSWAGRGGARWISCHGYVIAIYCGYIWYIYIYIYIYVLYILYIYIYIYIWYIWYG